ncbi:hypothetical protein [Streptomyces sp. NPDC014894]|uniref:hypothetical protein n=1 Tax=Streptomyces sp. NPDC014894 TaxID=3364931 RepID=UPI00370230C3
MDFTELSQETQPGRAFDVAMDGTLHLTLRADNAGHAHSRLADLESSEAGVGIALGDGVRLSHITYGTTDSYSLSPADSAPAVPGARPSPEPMPTAGSPDDYLLGRLLQSVTDQLNDTDSYTRAAALLDQILDPHYGLLEKPSDFFEAAAEKARDAESDDGFDLRDDLTDAAADVRQFGEQLHLASVQMRDLSPLPTPGTTARTTASSVNSVVLPPLPPKPGRLR